MTLAAFIVAAYALIAYTLFPIGNLVHPAMQRVFQDTAPAIQIHIFCLDGGPDHGAVPAVPRNPIARLIDPSADRLDLSADRRWHRRAGRPTPPSARARSWPIGNG